MHEIVIGPALASVRASTLFSKFSDRLDSSNPLCPFFFIILLHSVVTTLIGRAWRSVPLVACCRVKNRVYRLQWQAILLAVPHTRNLQIDTQTHRSTFERIDTTFTVW